MKLNILASLLAVAAMPFGADALTVRVDSAGGAPRLVVNGEPVRARMFWGAPGWSALPIEPEWKHIAFEFTATGSASNGTMHFRFGPSAGDIFLDEIEVTDVDVQSARVPLCDFEAGEPSFACDWTFWPPGAANTVGRIAVEPHAGRNGSSGLPRASCSAPGRVKPACIFSRRPTATSARTPASSHSTHRKTARWRSTPANAATFSTCLPAKRSALDRSSRSHSVAAIHGY
jgi:hypothetical protein